MGLVQIDWHRRTARRHRGLLGKRRWITPAADQHGGGAELQTEYFVPRARAVDALERVRRLAPHFAPLLQVGEIRTVAGDRLWLSGAHGEDVVALHLTWRRVWQQVYEVLPLLEEALLPLGGRPHWGSASWRLVTS